MEEKEFDFKEKLESMSIKDIVLNMIDSIENPVINLNFDTFGKVVNGICYGCAATNSLCKMSGKVFNASNIKNRFTFIDRENARLVCEFEGSIDALRNLYFNSYNDIAKKNNFAQMPEKIKHRLVKLDNDSIEKPKTLIAWKKFAENL